MKSVGFVFFLFSILGAYSYDMQGKWGLGFDYGSPMVQGTTIIKDSLDPNFSGAARLRYHFKNKQAFQLEYDHFEFDDAVSGERVDFGKEIITLNYLIGIFRTNSKWYNYLSLGIGSANVKKSGFTPEEDYWRTTYKVGLGFEYFITRWWNIGLALDYHMTDKVDKQNANTEIHIFNPSISTTFYFGSVAFADQDKDGVADRFDKCGDSPIGSYVDSNGCADTQRDSDNDGVNDREDKCTATPQSEKVDANGCSASQKDSDNDGIADKLDQCPNTDAGSKVNSAGCTEKESVEITLNINFAPSKAEIDPRFELELDRVAMFLKTYTDTKAEIQGHSDNLGKREWNIKLSQMRADSVKQYLVDKHNISESRLKAKGYGPDQPIADNNTEEGRKTNRRVMANFQSQ